ncbi:class D beta-lactamase [Burkholderia alba]|uniref:class D beta-lactamase n=1 Tax=Burkholderia alba TaxID=2683677 RepID=UPI002B05A2A8|nr:class D beta-lactamase [Burkholderia alba]
MSTRILIPVAFAGCLAASAASARTICTVVADAATGKPLVEQGDCAGRVTPASTFKIAISLMGFDSGFLKDEHAPTLPYRDGYPDWGGDAWRQPTDPARWIRYSVVWYSRQVGHALGEARFQRYIDAFGYGNRDASGAVGKHNGTSVAWNNSSLRISPLEQIAFLRKVVNRQLPVTPRAFDMTERITGIGTQPDGWDVHGKAGTGSPTTAALDGTYDRAHAYGWFVGWASKGTRTLVFARLIQDDVPTAPNAGVRARDALLAEWPALVDAASR